MKVFKVVLSPLFVLISMYGFSLSLRDVLIKPNLLDGFFIALHLFALMAWANTLTRKQE